MEKYHITKEDGELVSDKVYKGRAAAEKALAKLEGTAPAPTKRETAKAKRQRLNMTTIPIDQNAY
jgi:hypothetical protein